jgi:hypothetical protein
VTGRQVRVEESIAMGGQQGNGSDSYVVLGFGGG